MSTSATVEKKTKKPTKKASSTEAEVKTEQVQSAAPVATSVPVINEEQVNVETSETSEINSEFYSMMDKIVTSFNELNEISKKLDMIDEKQIKNFITEKKKMDKAINSFETTYLETLASAFKVAKKSGSKQKKTKSESSGSTTEPAVKKPLECDNCLHEFMGKTDTSELISRNQAYTSVTDFVKTEKKNNPDKISSNLVSDKEFRVYGKLKTFLDSVSKIIGKNMDVIKAEIKTYESSKPEEGSKQMKELINLRDEMDRLTKLKTIPEVMGYTNVMSYTNLCFNTDYLIKIKAKSPKAKK
mgnify:CR=1 FL=1